MKIPKCPYHSSIKTPPHHKSYKKTTNRQELANSQVKDLEETEHKNREVVLALYEALKSRDVKTVHQILAPDLEWWFHGPPTHQFMMRLLTGTKSSPSSSTDTSFEFAPLHITSFGPTVIAEGCDHSGLISWVHAWTVTDGIITQVREYFNTSLTVTRIGPPSSSSSSSSDCSPRSSTSSTVEINSVHCPSVWESSFSNRVGKSVPGLVLAI
ncbi:hypothetical protein Dsin_001712 [Dipteronia sinensis]|uniref:Wound-induced protein 1 n=1 Tax=Dipteronia sinensis TaxID=43782 RepID=A0AAE0B4W7_9ROSI|nr:hypothetical protein Dsin_001712 [Dipteronia sinensis]